MRQLLEGLLLNSGNDAAAALARARGGDAAATAAMTALARDLGALDTRAATPSGLDGPGMSTSAYDLALLGGAALRDPLLATVLATRQVPFPGWGDQPGFVLSYSDRVLGRVPGALGGKAGFTDAARHTLVGAAERGGRRLVVALVRAEQQPVPGWQQAAALLDRGFALPPGTPAVGVLVDGPPTPPPAPPAAAPAPPGAPPPAPDATAGAVGLAVAGLAVLVGALVVVRRRR